MEDNERVVWLSAGVLPFITSTLRLTERAFSRSCRRSLSSCLTALVQARYSPKTQQHRRYREPLIATKRDTLVNTFQPVRLVKLLGYERGDKSHLSVPRLPILAPAPSITKKSEKPSSILAPSREATEGANSRMGQCLGRRISWDLSKSCVHGSSTKHPRVVTHRRGDL